MGFQSKSNIDSSGVSKGERSRWRVDLPDVRDMCDSVFELILLLYIVKFQITIRKYKFSSPSSRIYLINILYPELPILLCTREIF